MRSFENIKGNFVITWRKVKVRKNGKTEEHTKAIIIMTFSMEPVLIAGLMVGNIAGIGSILNLKEKVYLPGKMGENMLESTKITRNTDMESSNGLTEPAIVVIG